MEKRRKYRESIGRKTVPPGNLSEQIQYGKPTTQMWRTPDNLTGGSNLPGIRKALDEGHLKRPSGQPMQIRLHDQVKEPRLWPTPRASAAMNENIETIRKRNKKRGMLEDKVAMWPTPTAKEPRDLKKINHYLKTGEMRYSPTNYKNPRRLMLEETVIAEEAIKMWPTPSKGMYKQDVNDNGRYAKDIKKKGFQVMLPAAVKIWPTPNASDNRDRGNLSDPAIQRRIKMGKQVGLTMAVKDQKGGGTLNPMWVEWLMGYPIGWTDLNHSETA
tara:strand:- start:1430 stop:2245 length:816 start_codon:yes stop_codon:yes gene_type:complete